MPAPARRSNSSVTNGIRRTQRTSFILLALNPVGAVLYVWFASRGWRIQEEKGMIPVTGEPYVWAVGIFPVWAFLLLLNAIWALLIIKSREWGNGRLWLLNLPIWLIAAVIDFVHH
jgi:hypothetical protein